MGLVSFGLELSRGWLLIILNASLDFIKFLDWMRKRDIAVQVQWPTEYSSVAAVWSCGPTYYSFLTVVWSCGSAQYSLLTAVWSCGSAQYSLLTAVWSC
jgi:hypothetical protein